MPWSKKTGGEDRWGRRDLIIGILPIAAVS
jgi:hypothetical protein